MDLTTTLSKNWSVLLVRGLIAIIFGVITWFAPNASLSIMLLFFAGYFLFDGMLRTWVAWNSKQHNPYWRWLLAGGVLSIIAGLVTLFAPNVTAILLLYYVAAWAIAIGAVEILIALKLRAEISNEWILIITGAISVLFGLYLIFNPSAGIHTLLWLVATYAVLFGALIVLFSLKLKKMAQQQ
ncbi:MULTISPECIES: HdeD family acid-resistance protein [Pseudoalteromonas]|uniref:HdeD family acid-resistance protein n=1 Tax=Pseudoalteromonas rhizosphaerae TaxID=2518973 RepID=A0ABW8KV89_9GAMM|nr:HdeD family acid-resistance protein [Pseudoalteromonas sp. SR41-4]MBB1294255.1 HdeD family acid-resistance protein [Pseudoalteromonas sp. SR41-4]